MILNIHNFNGQSLITNKTTYNPELVHLFQKFFLAAQNRNQKQKRLLERLSAETDPASQKVLITELFVCQEEEEVDIELVKALLP